MSGGSANFETVYSVYGRQPAAAIIAEAETRRSVSGARPKLTYVRLCRRSASGYGRLHILSNLKIKKI